MTNDLRIFESADFGQIRIAGTSEEPLFCLADVCRVLELRVDGVLQRLPEDGYNQIGVIDTMGRKQKAYFVNEESLYRVIFRSDKEQAKQFQNWVFKTVLPSIRKTGEYKVKAKKQQSIKTKMTFAAWAADFLNLNDNSKLLLAQKIGKEVGMDDALPQYTASHGIVKPISVLLKEHGKEVSARTFNQMLEKNGYLAKVYRKSHKGEKAFYSITEKGSAFGENQVCPQNPKETQPLWYEDTFTTLFNTISNI